VGNLGGYADKPSDGEEGPAQNLDSCNPPERGSRKASTVSDSERVITSELDYRPSTSPERLRLAAFNRVDRDLAAALVQPCLGVERWWSAVVANRPYLDLNGLLEVSRDAAYPLTQTELEAALTQHLATRTAEWLPRSRALTPAGMAERLPSARLTTKLLVDLELYELRFGHPFVVRSTGRSVAEIADQLHARLRNDLNAEEKMIATQLRQIALLQLTQRVID
jgi:2-oxo-4-hydroxy-4-carboxy-5-ureidoimidazoline decarboxylase